MDHAAIVGGEEVPPRPGDLSLCLRCGMVHIFDKAMMGRIPTTDEMIKMTQNKQLNDIILRAQLALTRIPNKPSSQQSDQ